MRGNRRVSSHKSNARWPREPASASRFNDYSEGHHGAVRPQLTSAPGSLGPVGRRHYRVAESLAPLVDGDAPGPQVLPVLALDPHGTVVHGHEATNGSRDPRSPPSLKSMTSDRETPEPPPSKRAPPGGAEGGRSPGA